MLKPKTDKVNLQGKPQVYFTCHSADYERFFEMISNDILKIIDCTIWYNTDDEYDDMELGQLESMNLFVLPVTTKLLTNLDCRTMKIDVPFALDNKKHILPIMMEDGLEELFNKHFKNMHFLDPNKKNENLLSYQEQLKKHLDSYLIGGELAEKVRAEFDAYIFLSYRKKDWKYRDELRQLIHKNDSYRDIAIWADVNLVAGNNFDQTIKDVIKNSKLFAMVVTPNLVNESNYVKTDEYPTAITNEKPIPILPAEMEKTDHELLSEWYPGIPDCVDARDEIALSKALAPILLNTTNREKADTPQHNFLIGMAYLDGIDVEVNYERALSLITSAAEAKENPVPEAIEKLVSIYTEGYIIKQDYHIVSEWQQKLVDYWEHEYKIHSNIDVYKNLFSALLNLGNQLLNLNKLETAENAYNRMFSLCKQWKKKSESNEIQHNLSVSYLKLGDVYERRRNFGAAEEYYRNGLELGRQLAEKLFSYEARCYLSFCYDKLGNLREAMYVFDEAEEFYRKGLYLRVQLVEETGSMESRWDLSVSNKRLGNLYRWQGNLERSEKSYKESLLLLAQLVEETRSVDVQQSLLANYNELGNIRSAKGDLEGAEEFHKKGLIICERLAKEPGTVEDQRNLSYEYYNLGNIRRIRCDFDGAEEFYQKGLVIYEQLVGELETVEDRLNLSYSYDNLGEISETRGKLDEAEQYYLKGLALREALADETETVEAHRDLSLSYYRLGDIAKARGNLDDAERFYQKSLAMSEALADETGTVESWRDLSVSYNMLGDLSISRSNLDDAERYYLKSLALREALAKETSTVKARRDLSLSYERLGDIANARGNLDDAEQYYQKSLALREALADETGTVEAHDNLAISYYTLSIIQEPYNRNLLENALQIFTNLAEQCPEVMRYSENRDKIKHILEQII